MENHTAAIAIHPIHSIHSTRSPLSTLRFPLSTLQLYTRPNPLDKMRKLKVLDGRVQKWNLLIEEPKTLTFQGTCSLITFILSPLPFSCAHPTTQFIACIVKSAQAEYLCCLSKCKLAEFSVLKRFSEFIGMSLFISHAISNATCHAHGSNVLRLRI
jgi:hypothetical protein